MPWVRRGSGAGGATSATADDTRRARWRSRLVEQHYFIFDIPYAFEDRGGNRGGCGQQTAACQVLSTGLQPPPPPL